ncbi:hypothetical protein [Adhaeribacter pallidiroseus]|uniref:Uncharacterized protein n=1 Tax=Adhaeribacter pallidiroseus TaxID=2072847 RepID=A0A369QL93_9BACT|nr:hypothetical protein [Adhaeribacter pallidiroseus]RDC64017.1 hypothetical protein AHMF7616_02627 [Adhaeribacter pallidiroseus]
MSELEKSKDNKFSGSDKIYRDILEKLRATFKKYNYIPEIAACEQAGLQIRPRGNSQEERTEYLLEIVMGLLQAVPNSPFIEELFNNFLKDYIHFVNPEHVYHLAEYYLTDDFILKHKSEWLQDQKPKIRYI